GSTVLLPEFADRAEKILVSWSKPHPELAGQELAAIARRWEVSLEQAIERLRPAGGIYFSMDEADVRAIMAYPHSMIGSDGLPHDEFPHPRLWGTFPRVLGHYARDLGLLTLEDAIHRMTGLPASRFGLAERGVIATGAYADLVLFDPGTIIDRATFEQPKLPAQGIRMVMVNGLPVRRDGAPTAGRPGRVLRRRRQGSPATSR